MSLFALTAWAAPPDSSSSRKMIFDEEFNSSGISPGSWSVLHRAGDYSNHELECYKPANIAFANGILTMTSQVQSALCGDADHSKSMFGYTSAMLQWTKFNFTYGALEIRAKTAGGQGSWPAIWLLGSDCQTSNLFSADNIGTCNWPNPGSEEIDVLEIINSSYGNVYHNLFNGTENFCQQTTSDTSQNFHVYTMNWEPGLITFGIDGEPAACSFTTGVPSTPMFLIINNAMGGLAGSVDNQDFPQTMMIDYVRVFAP